MSGNRRGIQASIRDALWAISNGRCYAPGCPFPVMFEVRPGVYRKNVQIAHIYGVRPEAARYRHGMPDSERDAFKHLLLLCLPHHAEVDDRITGESLYPPDKLLKWKQESEGGNKAVLDSLGPVDENLLMDAMADAFEPPIKRLEAIAEQLERTGTLNANSVEELRDIISVLTENPVGPDARTVQMLTDAIDSLGGPHFRGTVHLFHEAATKYSRTRRAFE